MTTKRFFKALAAAAVFAAAAAVPPAAAARNLVWANAGADMNDAANWTDAATGAPAASAPSAEDRLFFPGVPGVQPRLTSALDVRAVCFGPVGENGRTEVDDNDGAGGFSNSGWTVSADDGAELRLAGSFSGTGGWNFHFSQASRGTNVVAAPVRFTATGGGNRPLEPSGGRIVFAGPVSSDSATGTFVVDGGRGGAVEFAAANPGLQGTVQVGNWSTLAFSDPGAFGSVGTIRLNHAGYSTEPQFFLNETGGPVSLPGVTRLESTAKNVACHIGGDGAIDMPNAVWAPRLNDSREFFVDVPLSVKSVENGNASAGAYSFRKLGPATLRVAERSFAGAPEGQTNRFDVVDGAILFGGGGPLENDFVMFGIKGTVMDGYRPALGLDADLAVPDGGTVPGGLVCFGDHAWCVGFAAFGGDRTVEFFGGADYVMVDPESKTAAAASVSAPNSGAGGTDWFKRCKRFVFGAPDADGAAVLANDVDVNVVNGAGTANFQVLCAEKGAGPVAGRVAGRIYNGGAAGNSGARVRKDGGGVLALDGDVELATETEGNASTVRQGGLLVNGVFEGAVAVTNTLASEPFAWLGGTGTLRRSVFVQGGGALRAGDENGLGSLELAGPLVLEDGARIVARIGETTNNVLRCTGTGCDYRAEGTVVVRIEAAAGLATGRDVKLFDWSGATDANYLTMADPSRYVFEMPEGSAVRLPSVRAEGGALWLKFSVDNGRPFKLLFE